MPWVTSQIMASVAEDSIVQHSIAYRGLHGLLRTGLTNVRSSSSLPDPGSMMPTMEGSKWIS